MAATFLAAASAVLMLMVVQPATTDVSEQYVKLVLALGEHDRDYVDAYYGPPEWRVDVKNRKPDLAAIDAGEGRHPLGKEAPVRRRVEGPLRRGGAGQFRGTLQVAAVRARSAVSG